LAIRPPPSGDDLGDDGVDAALVDGLDHSGADREGDVPVETGHPVALGLDVDVEATVGAQVGVGETW
jgi:hypothetical protein